MRSETCEIKKHSHAINGDKSPFDYTLCFIRLHVLVHILIVMIWPLINSVIQQFTEKDIFGEYQIEVR